MLWKAGKILSAYPCQVLNARHAHHPAYCGCPHMECIHSGFSMAPAHLYKALTPAFKGSYTDPRTFQLVLPYIKTDQRTQQGRRLFSFSS